MFEVSGNALVLVLICLFLIPVYSSKCFFPQYTRKLYLTDQSHLSLLPLPFFLALLSKVTRYCSQQLSLLLSWILYKYCLSAYCILPRLAQLELAILVW